MTAPDARAPGTQSPGGASSGAASAPPDAPGLFPDTRPDIPTDDWDDQDLLTKDEARLRLERTAAMVRADLASARENDPAAVAGLELQLGRIELVLRNIAR